MCECPMTPALIHHTYMTHPHDVLYIPPPLPCTASSDPSVSSTPPTRLTWTTASTSSAPSLGAPKTHRTQRTVPPCRERGVRWYHHQQRSHRKNTIVDIRAFPLQPLCRRSQLPQLPLPQCRHARHTTQETGAFLLRQPCHHSRLPELPLSR